MRLQEDVVRAGYFWLPATPDTKLPGTLTIRDGGEAELEVVGNFDIDQKSFNDSLAIPRIVGRVEKEGFVTLDDCYYLQKAFPLSSIAKSTLYAAYAIFGVKYDEDEPLEYNTFQFGVEGLEEWIGISGVTYGIAHKDRCANISYAPPEDRRVQLGEEIALSILFDASVHGASHAEGARITERNYLKLESERPLPLDAYAALAKKLTNFLCFAVDATVCMKDITVTNREIKREFSGGVKHVMSIKLYYASRPHTDEPSKAKRHSYLFRFDDVADQFEACVGKWLAAYEQIEPSLNLYFSTKHGGHRYLEPQFLALAQAVETLHRRTSSETLMPQDEYKELLDQVVEHCPRERQDWLKARLAHGNELPLRQRLSEVAEPFADLLGGDAVAKRLVKKTLDTRNYLTHYDPGGKSRSAHGAELVPLIMQLEALLELHLLQRVGFSPDEIVNIARAGPRLSQKLRYGRETGQ